MSYNKYKPYSNSLFDAINSIKKLQWQITPAIAAYKLGNQVYQFKKMIEPAVSVIEAAAMIKSNFPEAILNSPSFLQNFGDDQNSLIKSLKALQANPHFIPPNYTPINDIISAISYKSILDQIGVVDAAKFNLYYSQEIDLFELDDNDENEVLNSNEYGATKESGIILLPEFNRIKELIQRIYIDHREMYKMEPRRFEEMVAELLRNDGYTVELTKQTRDGGYDILALAPMPGGFAPTKLLVECKRYREDRPVDVNIIRSLRDVIEDGGHRGLIVTSSYVTSDAKKRANLYKTPYHLEFREKDDIIQWVERYLGRGLS